MNRNLYDTRVGCAYCGVPLRGTEIFYVGGRACCSDCAPNAPLWWDDNSYMRYQADFGDCPRCGREECGDPELVPCTLWGGVALYSDDYCHMPHDYSHEPPF